MFQGIDNIIVKSLQSVQKIIINDKHCFEMYGYNVFFFINNFFIKLFQEPYQIVKQFRSRSGPTFRPDLGPNCLQRSSVDDKIRR